MNESLRHITGTALLLALLHGTACAEGFGSVVAGIAAQHAFPPFAPEEIAALEAAASAADASAAKALTAILQRRDRYAAVMTYESLASMTQSSPASSSEGGAGVGMDIVAGRGGCIVCIPEPGSPAEKAGMRIGDMLIAADGTPLLPPEGGGADTLPPEELLKNAAAILRGQEGSAAELRIVRGLPPGCTAQELRSAAGRVIDMRIVRRRAAYPTASRTDQAAPLPCIRITRFGSETGREVAALLKGMPSGMPIVIDLRGNTGGSVKAMLDVLRRFLPGNAVMVHSRTRSGEKVIRNRAHGSHAGASAYLWQDGLTASAAEVFIAAMRGTDSALSIGVRSAGKSCAQEWFRAGRDRVKITTEELLLPGEDFGWQDSGLAPDMPLAPGEEYRSATLKASGVGR